MEHIFAKLILSSIMIILSALGLYDFKKHEFKTFSIEFCLWILFLVLGIVYFILPVLSILSID